MKKVKECVRKKLSIRFPNVTLTTKIDADIKLKKGDYIKLELSNIDMYAIVVSSQYTSEDNIDKIEVEDVEHVAKSKIKQIFVF